MDTEILLAFSVAVSKGLEALEELFPREYSSVDTWRKVVLELRAIKGKDGEASFELRPVVIGFACSKDDQNRGCLAAIRCGDDTLDERLAYTNVDFGLRLYDSIHTGSDAFLALIRATPQPSS